jgi:hypothetical protein
MITAEHAKESLCRSYVIAVASAARQNLWLGGEHDYGVDGIFRLVEPRGDRLRETGFSLDFQAKASVDWNVSGESIAYDLEAKNYNVLAERATQTRSTPFFLVLLCLPREEKEWVQFTADSLTVKRCAYYLQLSGGLTGNAATCRVSIPQTNALTPASLTTLLERVKSGAIQP